MFRICLLIFFLSPCLLFAQGNELAPDAGSVEAVPVVEIGNEVQDEDNLDVVDPFISALPANEIAVFDLEDDVELEPLEEQEPELDLSVFQVSGLVWGQAAPKAIINDNVYGIGDELEGAKILNISKEGILFGYNNKKYLLNRDGSSVADKGGKQ